MKRITILGFGLAVALIFTARVLTAQETGGWVLLDGKATTLVKQGTEAMYNLRYAEADSIFNALIVMKPEHPAGYFLLALVDWWRIVPNSSVQSIMDRIAKSFNERIDKTIEMCDKRLAENPNDIIGLFFKGSALGYRARLIFLGNNMSEASVLDWANAASEGKEAYDIILRCQRLAPSNSDILLGSGLYNYIGAYIPEKYPAIKGALGFLPPGDKKIGISMLRIASQRAVYSSTEAKYSLLEVLSLWEDDQVGALKVADDLHQRYPANAVFHRFLAKCLYLTNEMMRADTEYVQILKAVEARKPGYELSSARQSIYYLGDVRLHRASFEPGIKSNAARRDTFLRDAIRYFKQADQLSRSFGEDDGSWNIMAVLHEGNAYDMLGQRADALREYERSLDMPDYKTTSGSAHDLARKYITQPYVAPP